MLIPLTLQRTHFTNEKTMEQRERPVKERKGLDPRLWGPFLVSSVCSHLTSPMGDLPSSLSGGPEAVPGTGFLLESARAACPTPSHVLQGCFLKKEKSLFFFVKEPTLDHLSQSSSRAPSSKKTSLISPAPSHSPTPQLCPWACPFHSSLVVKGCGFGQTVGFQILVLPFSQCGLWDLRLVPSPESFRH